MRINENTVLVGKTVILVPYRKEHVPRYHEWMKSPELQELTASEPLTLKEEYEMQESWRKDNDKCTFILLKPVEEEKSIDDIVAIRDPEELAKYMIGDVNLYLNDPHEPHHGEIEVMIAEPAYRQKGAAREALKIMMNYGVEKLGVTKYIARILMKNKASLNLFNKLGYIEYSRSEVFEQINLSLDVDSEKIKTQIKDQVSYVIEHTFI